MLLYLVYLLLFYSLGFSHYTVTSELLGRVEPDIRDILIAFFGGSALIIARTKREPLRL